MQVWRDRALAADPRRMAALGAAVLLGVQLAANYWSATYLAWVFPLVAVALLSGSRAASPHVLTYPGARIRRCSYAVSASGTRFVAPGGAPVKFGGPLLHEGGARLAEVVGRDQDLLEGDLLLEDAASVGFATPSARASRSPTASGDAASSSSTSSCVTALQLRRRRDAVGRADPVALGSAPIVRPVMISSLAMPSPTTAGSRLEPPTSGIRPELRLGQAELHVVGHHAQVAGERQLGAEPEAGAVDLRDHRLGHLLEQVGGLDAVAPEGAQVLVPGEAAELEDVDAGAERGALAAQHHAVDVGVVGRLARRLAQREHEIAG